MQHADLVPMRDRCDEDVDRRQAVMTNPRELPMSVERESFDVVVDCEMGESTKLVEEVVVLARMAP